MSRYFDVVFDLPADRTFTYAYGGDALCGPGFRVVAPFSGRMLTGYIIGELSGPPDVEFEIKELKRVIDPSPLYDAGHIELARWMGDMYLCSQGEALSGMLPGGREESAIPAIEEQDPEDFRPHDP